MAENPTGAMQEAAFQALGLNWRYLTIEVPPDQLGPAIAGVRASGMKGVNLTIPHKVAVMEHLDEIAPDAAVIGAVNTVRRNGARLIGENTDGKGFLRGVRNDAGSDPRGKRVVVLGAGGAARVGSGRQSPRTRASTTSGHSSRLEPATTQSFCRSAEPTPVT